jgi:hypothetical protein
LSGEIERVGAVAHGFGAEIGLARRGIEHKKVEGRIGVE